MVRRHPAITYTGTDAERLAYQRVGAGALWLTTDTRRWWLRLDDATWLEMFPALPWVIGDATNNVTIGTDGHLTLAGTARVWDDIRIEPSVRSSGTNVPAFSQWFTNGAGSRGIYLYTFDNAVDASEKEVHFTCQLPHAWAGTPIHIHVHWIAATTAASSKVRWGLEYSWAEPLTAFGNTALIYATDPEGGDTGTTQYKHMITEFANLTPSTAQDGFSSTLICRLWRDSSDAADTYTNSVGLLYIDAHIELNKMGSNDEYS